MKGSRRPGTWTPFVGVALAALTAGSLIVFSVIAQRTSLDGFSARGVAAQNPSATSSGAITLPPASGGAAGSADTDDFTSEVATAPGSISPTTLLEPESSGAITTGTAAAVDGSDDVAIAASDTDSTPSRFNDSPRAAHSYNGERKAVDRTDDDEQASRDDEKAKGKKAKAKKSDGNKSDRRSERGASDEDARAHKRSRGNQGQKGHRHKHHSRAHRGHRAQGHGSNHGRGSASSHGRSQPSPSARPQRQQASKPARPQSAPPSHSNGHGKSKSRGRGHR